MLLYTQIACYILIALQALDGHSTYIAIKNGYGTETNGIVGRVLSQLGLVPGLLVVKVGTTVALYWVATQLPTMMQQPAEAPFVAALFIALAVFYTVIVVKNYRIYFAGKARA